VGTATESGTSPATEESPTPADQVRGAAGTAMDPVVVGNVRDRWSELLRSIQPVTLRALLRDADVGGMDSKGHLVLAFQHAFHCKKVSETANLRQIEDALVEIFHQPIAIRCLLKDEWAAQASSSPIASRSPTAGRSPAASRQPQAVRTQASRVPRAPQPDIPLEEDELIRRAQEELGAVARVNDR